MKHILIFLLVIIWHRDLFAQSSYEKTFSSERKLLGLSLVRQANGSFLIGGSIGIKGEAGAGFFALQIDTLGNELEARYFSIPLYEPEASLIQTTDNKYVLLYPSDTGYLLVKFNSMFEKEWITQLDTFSLNNSGCKVIQTLDGGFATIGSSGLGGSALIKLNSEGKITWYCTPRRDMYYSTLYTYSFIQNNDSSFLVTGFDLIFGLNSLIIAKVSPHGVILWRKAYKDKANTRGDAIIATSDNGYVVVGTTTPYNGGDDLFILKCDSLGNKIWSKTLDAHSNELGYDVAETSNGDLIVCGIRTTTGSNAYARLAIIKLSLSGVVKSFQVFDSGDEESSPISLRATYPDAVMVVGTYGSTAYSMPSRLFVSNLNDTTLSCHFNSIPFDENNSCTLEDSSFKADTTVYESRNDMKITSSSTHFVETNLCDNAIQKKEATKPIVYLLSSVSNRDGFFAIKIVDQSLSGIYLISINNILGQQIYKKAIYLPKEDEEIRLGADIPSGLYLISLINQETGATIWKQKLIK